MNFIRRVRYSLLCGVMIAALAPDEGRSMGELFGAYEAMPGMDHIRLDDEGVFSMTPEGIANYFAHDLPAAETAVLNATQAPTAAMLRGDFSAVSTQLYDLNNSVLRKQERKIPCPNSNFETV